MMSYFKSIQTALFKESALRPILSSSRDVSLYIYLSIYMSPFMRFSQGIKGGPRGAKPVCLLKKHVHHLQFPDEKAKQSQSVSSKSTSITCNFLMKKCNSMQLSQGSKASLSPQRACPSPAIS